MGQLYQIPTTPKNPILRKWRREVERLYIQLHLHGNDSLTYFEIQRSKLYFWLENMQEKVSQYGEMNKEVSAVLITKMQNLRFELSTGHTNTMEELINQQKATNKKLDELQQFFYIARHVGSVELTELVEEMEAELINYQTKFNLFGLRTRMTAEGMKTAWNKKQKLLSQKLRAIHAALENGKEEAVESLKYLFMELNS